MKRLFLTALALFVATSLSAAPVLFEDYQEGQISIPIGETDTITVAQVSFFVDSTYYVQLGAGGMIKKAKVWLKSDEGILPPVIRAIDGVIETPIAFIYIYLVSPGEHTISLCMTNYSNSSYPSTCVDAYLQALIFLPDTGSGVAEQPMSDAEPLPNTPSLISQGPYVNVAGATELVDATGRVIENAIEEDKVFISNLSTGTYFARDGERTIVKIVKVD